MVTDSPLVVRQRLGELVGVRRVRERELRDVEQQQADLAAFLGIADKVSDALEILSQKIFKDVLKVVESKATIALQEILEQPKCLRADSETKYWSPSVEFWIDHEGQREDVYRGQGGSVQNILSVTLRLFALTTLDPAQHRRFLVLDEQDCWLRADLVPRLVKIVQEAGKALGFQVIMISHHDVSLFERHADKVYRLTPLMGGAVDVREVARSPGVADDPTHQ